MCIDRMYYQSPMQTDKSKPEGKWIMPETRFTEFPALSVGPRVGISRSASETDVLIIFLTYDINKYYLLFVISFIFYILCRKTTFSKRRSVSRVVVYK